MRNKRGQNTTLGFVLIILVFIFILTSFVTIAPFKESLDTARDTTSLNCPGTASFNQSDYEDDNDLERLTRRPTCFVTGISMVYFIGSFVIASFVWLVSNWRKFSK